MENVPRPVQSPYGRMEDALERWSRHEGQPWHRDYLAAIDEAIGHLEDVRLQLNCERDVLIAQRRDYAARRPS